MRLRLALALLLSLPAMARAQRAENALTWGFATQIETMNPYATAKRTVQLLTRNVLEPLVYRDPVTAAAKPLLASSWKWIDDKTLEFALQPDVTFSNGQSFDADDVVYTVQQVKRTDNPVAFADADYGYIDHAEKIDAHTVRLILKTPTPSAVDRLTQTLPILPHIAHAAMGAQDFGLAPIGTGPFRVASFSPGGQLTLTRNPAYHPALWGKPRLETIKVVTIPDPQTQTAELTRGRVDFLWQISPDQLAQIKGAPGVRAVTGDSVAIYFLSLDAAGRSGANPLQDRNVRLAIASAIERPAIAEVMQGPTSAVIDSPCHPKQFGCPKDVEKHPFDLARARAYLKASAYPNGFPLDIGAFTDGSRVAEAILGNLQEIGITGKVDTRETSAWVKELFAGHFRAAIVPWPSSGVYDVSALVPLFFIDGPGDYTHDPEIAGWFRQAGSITDPAERARLYDLGFRKIAHDADVVPLMTTVVAYGYRDGLDFTPPADGYPMLALAGWR